MSNRLMVTFGEMLSAQSLTDAVLHVEGTEFKVHKIVLCSCSSYFRALFQTWASPEETVFNIQDISADIMRVFIEFAYTDNVTVTADNLSDLFIAADRFDMAGITQACCKFLEESLCPNSCLRTLWINDNFYYPELKQKAFSYVLKHFEEVARCPDFLQLPVEDVAEIIKQDLLNVTEESTVFEAVLRWVNHSPQDRERHVTHLLSKVRLALMDPQYFNQVVMGNQMVRRSRKCRHFLNRVLGLRLETKRPDFFKSLAPYQACPRVPQAVTFAIGGWNVTNPTNVIEVFDKRSKQWVTITNSNIPVAYHETVFLNRAVYALGGFDGDRQLSTMHKLDLVNHTWQEVAPMHSRRCYTSVALLHGCIYAMGGFDGLERLKTAERYTPETNQWTMIAPMNEVRSDASSSTLNGKIYICGGFTGHHCLSTAESYDPLTNQWTMISDMSCRRSGVKVIACAGEIYAVGGFNGTERLNTVEAYNPLNNQWRPVPPMRTCRSNFGIAALDGQLYAVGGFDGSSTTNRAERFDMRTATWSDITDLGMSRSALSCCVVYDLPNMIDYCSPRATSELPEEEEEDHPPDHHKPPL